ncbi:alpha/beta hydrolase family protein [Actinoallomurus iriomotensis]|uniref:Lipase n=1 Tax=Actinoallomurus iriomotensis TaxID=478107 RepID=A0A9W6RMV7_9ACTN|nr:alpha/beta hydrolase [Actinoallomurus iriomotensis]GLY78796.1 lipase [Actinoallomurus iriomotensis]
MTDAREVLTRPAPPPDLTLRYGPHPDHVIDVRLPAASPGPLVVVLHGGFWRSAYDRTHTGPMASALASGGWVVAIPEYRRTGQEGGGWPGTFEDVAAALDAVPSLLEPYTAAPPVVLGHSAGGHLALWAATRPAARMRAVVSLAGCADLGMCSDLHLDDGATDLLLGGSPAEVPDRYAAADPVRLPVPSAPVRLLHGTSDDRVPIEVSRSYAARRDAPLRELPGVGHFALIDPLSGAWPAVLESLPLRPR